MPFHQRIVEPRHLSRLPRRDGKTLGEEDGAFIVVDGRKLRKPVLFTALDEVCSHTMINILHQLSDLSRNASDIFLGIEMEAGMVFQRSCRIQVRLETLHNAVIKFDHKKIKIRKCDCDVFFGCRAFDTTYFCWSINDFLSPQSVLMMFINRWSVFVYE